MKIFDAAIKMSERFTKKWEKPREKDNSFIRNLKDSVKPPTPLKPRMDYAIKRLTIQISRLDKAADRFNKKDKLLFKRIVDAYGQHDSNRANIYASELAEVRKMEKLVMNSKLALDQVLLRLETVSEFGDIVSTLGPAIGVLRTVGAGISGVLPEAANELGDIGNMLSGFMFDVGQSSGLNINFDSVNEDASKILAEAATVAEQKINTNLPDLPLDLPGALRKESTN